MSSDLSLESRGVQTWNEKQGEVVGPMNRITGDSITPLLSFRTKTRFRQLGICLYLELAAMAKRTLWKIRNRGTDELFKEFIASH